MSFVIAPDLVTAAAQNLSGIHSSLGEAAAAAAAPTSSLAAAGADEVSAAIARMFGTYGQEFQALNAQAAAFHAEFVSLLNGSGAAYLSTELANAQQALQSAMAPAAASAASDPLGGLLGGLGGVLGGGGTTTGTGGLGLGGLLGGSGGLLDPILFGGTGGLLGPLIGGNSFLASLSSTGPLAPLFQAFDQQAGAFATALIAGQAQQFLTGQLVNIPGLGPILQGLLPGIFGSPATPAPTGPPLNAWQMLYEHTNANLVSLNEAFARDPFPLASTITHNWQGYDYLTGRDFTLAFQNLPFELQHMPETLQIGAQGLASFDTAKYLKISADGTTGALNTINTYGAKFDADLNTNFAKFPSEWSLVNQDIAAGHYNLAVNDGTRAVLDLFLNGFDTRNLSNIMLLGPIADTFPILSLPGQELLGMSTLMTGHSVGQQMVANAGHFFTALTDTTVSATITPKIDLGHLLPLPVVLPSVSLGLDSNFGLALSMLFGVAGAPVAGLNGIATSGQIIGAGMLTGNLPQVLGGINDMPAYFLDGFLNGEVILDLPLPIQVDLSSIPVLGLGTVTIPVTAHLPFDGFLVPPHPLTATVPLDILGNNINVNLTLGGTKFGGLASLLTNSGFRTLADTITNTP
ncbi:MAG: PE family protein [Mycobacterium sp.]